MLRNEERNDNKHANIGDKGQNYYDVEENQDTLFNFLQVKTPLALVVNKS